MKRIFRSGDTSRVFNTLLNELNIPQVDTLISRMIQVFRTHAPTIALRPDADQLLARLRGAGMATGLITDGYAVAQHAKIDALNLRERIDVIIVTDDWGREFWKPHPRAFLEMADRLGVDHGACVYVGDNPSKDFVAPNQLGWDTVMVRRDEAVHAAVETADGGSPRRVIGDLSSF
jgi:putative hydrolase of the HAD superfamily